MHVTALPLLALCVALTGCVGGDIHINTAVGDGCFATRGGEAAGAGDASTGVNAAIQGLGLSRVGCPPEEAGEGAQGAIDSDG